MSGRTDTAMVIDGDACGVVAVLRMREAVRDGRG